MFKIKLNNLLNWKILIIIPSIIILVPIFVNILMKFSFSFFIAEGDINSWISFWGNYFGGIFGALIGGIVAYYVAKYQIDQNNQKNIEDEKNKRQYNIFNNLLTHTPTILFGDMPPFEFVSALNLIDIEFANNSEILDLKNKLSKNFMIIPKSFDDELSLLRLLNCRKYRILNLLQKIAAEFNIKLNISILDNIYYPQGYSTSNLKLKEILKYQLEILKGEKPLIVKLDNKLEKNDLHP